MQSIRASVAEFIGTFALTFVGGGAIIVTSHDGGGNLLAVAFAHGLILAVMVSATTGFALRTPSVRHSQSAWRCCSAGGLGRIPGTNMMLFRPLITQMGQVVTMR